MPNFDGTGPAGQGPLTGRGAGPCNPQNGAQGYGYGRRMRWGRGWFSPSERRGAQWTIPTPSLEEQEQILKEELEAVREARKEADKK